MSVDKENAGGFISVFLIELTKALRLVTTVPVTVTAMRNDEIRAKILRIFYDFELNHPGEFMNISDLHGQLRDVPRRLIDTNLPYLCDSELLKQEAPGVEGGGIYRPYRATTPRTAKITLIGINVVRIPELANKYAINLPSLQTRMAYGHDTQASQLSAVAQTQPITFDYLREMVQVRREINADEKAVIKLILDALETTAQQGTLTKNFMDESLKVFAKHRWLIPPLTEVLKHASHFD
ncbi:MAG TPA: hypothetical protein VLV18_06460 [Terriglobales bacterium]|nr:hypothetical protein [Terriglobales bacterium]